MAPARPGSLDAAMDAALADVSKMIPVVWGGQRMPAIWPKADEDTNEPDSDPPVTA